MIRSFIAISLPESLIGPLSELRESLVSLRMPVRWLSPLGMHLTLVFLGDQTPQRIEKISPVLLRRTSQAGAFSLSFGPSGVFPNPARPRIVWIGVQTGREELAALQRDIVRDVTALPGVTVEKRPFSPHLTLGRVKSHCDVTPALQMIDQATVDFRHVFPVTSIQLYESVLRPSGAEYRTIATCPLGDAQQKEMFHDHGQQ